MPRGELPGLRVQSGGWVMLCSALCAVLRSLELTNGIGKQLEVGKWSDHFSFWSDPSDGCVAKYRER